MGKIKSIIFFEQFLIKGWEVGILLLLPILKLRGEISLPELVRVCLTKNQDFCQY